MNYTETVRGELCRVTCATAGEAEYLIYGARLASEDLFTRHTETARRLLTDAREYPDTFGECRLERGAGGYTLVTRKALRDMPPPDTTEHSGALLRGAFLMRGYVSPPEGRCQFNIRLSGIEAAHTIAAVFDGLGIKCGLREVRGIAEVYMRSVESVSETLGQMGAMNAYLKSASSSVMKQLRSGVQRTVNCDNGNVEKTREAALRQISAIERINAAIGIDHLPEALREIADLRLWHESAPLEEIGQLCKPPVGKSAAASRMRRIEEIAAKLNG